MKRVLFDILFSFYGNLETIIKLQYTIRYRYSSETRLNTDYRRLIAFL